jgi:hypothetical protein
VVRSTSRVVFSCLAASVALLTTSAPAAAARKPITGELSKPGYTVIALAANGDAKVVRASRGKFELRPPAGRVSLHLRAPNGTYAGPIVVKRKGKRAILGVRAGAKLGKVKIRTGYAVLSKKLRKRWVDATRRARAKNGVPIGARVFGRVRSKHAHGGAPGDRDLDGISDPLDIDDDGDLVLDNLDRSTGLRAAQQVLDNPLLRSELTLGLTQTVNANAAAVTDEQVEAALSGPGARLGIGIPSGGSTELDCAGDPNADPPRPGLVYCSRGGTGIVGVGASAGQPFPECCDPDNDGFGTMVPPTVVPPNSGAGAMGLEHRTAQIKTGDVLVKRVNDGNGVEIATFTDTLQYVFATVPALVSYHDTAVPANSRTLSYPYSASSANELPVAAGPGGDVVVTLTFWRPQRRPIGVGASKEACLDDTPPCDWIDIGGLNYRATTGDGHAAGDCPQGSFSENDPNLEDPSSPILGGRAGGFRDSRQPPDQPANANDTLTYTLNLTGCLESNGFGSSFDESDETVLFGFMASPPSGELVGGVAGQVVTFKRQ